MRQGLILFISSAVAFGMASCRKYEDGGYLRDAERNLIGHPKKLVQYTANGIDSLPHVVNMLGCSQLTVSFGKRGNQKTVGYNADPNCNELKRGGKWSLGTNRRTLFLTFINEKMKGPIAGTTWDIKKLNEDEVWLEKQVNDIHYEAIFKKVY